MRPTSGAILVAAGAFLIVGAVATPLAVAPALVKVPLDQSSVTISKAQNATVLDFGTLSERTAVNLTAHRAVRGDVKDGNADRAVFNVGVRVIDDASKKEITVSTDRVALDRRTAMAVACCAEDINGAAFKHEGLTYTFPFGTEKKTYQYFDNTARKAYPAKYVSTEKLQGLTVYKFEMTVEPIKISEIKVPGSLLGSSEPAVNAGRYYANTRTLWVEPDSGVIVKGQEKQLQTLRDGTGPDKLKIIDADLAFTEDTQKQQAKAAKDARDQINLLTTVVPIVLGLLGLALVLLGLYLVIRAARRGPEAALVETGDQPTTDLPSQASSEPVDEPTVPAGGRHAVERSEP
ncbi:DUF3068 domain-containing protein [Micromonospora parathelypteridis]|uniref:DUF3068 domain-containing protein n=1 Tax=Micromonospora parathelypteridis TaxID=1839617 RepID=A0A840VN73_9ACTN|nr:DUF3068 domain-containing protein [Micromonospora parathelypteridis]MBB5478115.1 hypothetical protein [Micromonospora parathelypteridis]GGO13454.1 hypothetical protein GCM10011576_23590 [Micromonospora parathelypteridis]